MMQQHASAEVLPRPSSGRGQSMLESVYSLPIAGFLFLHGRGFIATTRCVFEQVSSPIVTAPSHPDESPSLSAGQGA